MIRKLIVIMVFVSLNTGAFAHVDLVVVDSLGYPVSKPIPFDSVVAGFDRSITVSEELVLTVQDGMAKEDVIVYIRKHLDVFAPLIAFILLYAVWLAKRHGSGKI